MEEFFIKPIVPKTRTSQGGWPADDQPADHDDDDDGGVDVTDASSSADRQSASHPHDLDALGDVSR